jgi:hypothetical protein
MIRTILHIPRRIVQALIVLYQYTLSPDHGWASKLFKYRVCRFHPSCSEYGHKAIGKYGVIKGGLMASWRVLRCNPWTDGGNDPVK